MNYLEQVFVTIEEGMEKYDQSLKQVMSNPMVLARIMKHFLPEYKNIPLTDIETKYIDEKSISQNKVYVEKNLTNAVIEGIGNEDKSNNEGNVTYDIMFRACYPDKESKSIGLYINLEMQQDYYPGYPMEARGVYYAARRLTSQIRKIDKDTDYGILEKVYSIWLCMGNNTPKYAAGTVDLYEIEKRCIIGDMKVGQKAYDLISVIVIRLNDYVDVEDPVLRMLQIICSKNMDSKEKISQLDKYGIHADEKMKGAIERMNGFGAAIAREAARKGSQETLTKEKRETAVRAYRMTESAETAAYMAGVTVKQAEEWLEEEGMRA